MADAKEDLRARLARAGLVQHADALLGLASPSIRLRGDAEDAARMLVRPPVRVWGLEGGVTAIAASHHKLALREDGTVVAWGPNDAGQLGDGTTKPRRTPVPVAGLTNVTAVAAGGGYSLALTSSGGVLAWGNNEVGQLGDGSRSSRSTPAPVPGLERGVVAIVAGAGRSLALLADGSVVAWGLNAVGEVGLDHVRPSPCPVPGLEGDAVAIAAGSSHNLALTSGGSVLAWGIAGRSGLGVFTGTDLSRPPHLTDPAAVTGLPDGIRVIAAGEKHNLAITAEGAVLAWGHGFFGELGDGSKEDRYPPVVVSGLSAAVRAVAAGNNCSYAIREDGGLFSWGWNDQGRLGDGTTSDRSTPRPVAALPGGVTAIGDRLALMDDGSVVAWGGEYPADEHGADARLDLAASKLGGRPDLRPGSRWPVRDGRPLSFVAQINLAEAAPLDRAGLLPSGGLLSFFYSPAGRQVDHSAVLYSPLGTPLSRRAFPAALADDERYAAVGVTPHEQLTLPAQPPEWLTAQERQAYGAELYTIADEPIHRLLGHPDPVQSDPREGLILLLQIDSDDQARMAWGDLGRLYFLIDPQDLRTQRFDAARCAWQSH